MKDLTKEQELAIRCAYTDLMGIVQCLVNGKGTIDGIDTDAIQMTLQDLEITFPNIRNLKNEGW